MYSSNVILVFVFFLTVSINGLNAESDSSLANKTESDVLLQNKTDTIIASRILAETDPSSSEGTTVQPESFEITKANSTQQNATDSSEIASRIGLNLELPPPADTIYNSNGFIPSFLKTFRRKRNLVVNEDLSIV